MWLTVGAVVVLVIAAALLHRWLDKRELRKLRNKKVRPLERKPLL